MAIAEVSGQRNRGSALSADFADVVFPSNVTAGNLLTVTGAGWKEGSGFASIVVTDTIGTTYTVKLAPTGAAWATGMVKTFIAYGIAPSSGANTVRVDPNTTGNFINAAVDEFSGVHATPLDVDGGESTGTSTTPSDGLTTVTANALVLAVVGVGGGQAETFTVGSGYTMIDQEGSIDATPYAAEFKIAGAAGAQTADFSMTASAAWTIYTAAFKEAVTGTISPPAGSAGLSGIVSAVVRGTRLIPAVASLLITTAGIQLTPMTGALVIEEAVISSDLAIKPGGGALAATGQSPGVGAAAKIFTPNTGSLVLARDSPLLAPLRGSVTFTGQTPIVRSAKLIAPSTGTLAATGGPPGVGGSRSVTPTPGSLLFEGAAPGSGGSAVLTPNQGALTLSFGTRLTPNQGAVAFVGLAPTLGRSATLTPAAAALVATGQAGQMFSGTGAAITPNTGQLFFGLPVWQPPVGSLSLAGEAPSLRLNINKPVPTAAAALTGTLVGRRVDAFVTPAAATLTAAGQVPRIQAATITPVTGTLTITGYVSGPASKPDVGALALQGQTPSRIVALPKTPTAGVLTLLGSAPLRIADTSLTPAAGAVQAAGTASTIGWAIRPPVGSLTLAGEFSGVNGTATIQPVAGALVAASDPPTVQASGQVTLEPSTGSLTTAGLAASLLSATIATPSAAALTAAGQAPSINAGAQVSRQPATGALSLEGVATGVRVSLTPATGTLALAGSAPSVRVELVLIPATGALDLDGQAGLIAGPRITPDTGALDLTGEAPILQAPVTLTPTTGAVVVTGQLADLPNFSLVHLTAVVGGSATLRNVTGAS